MINNRNNKFISYELLSANTYATKILIENKDKIDWFMAIENENIGELFKAFPDKISALLMKYVVKYPSVIPFLKDYLYDVSLYKLAENPSIFMVDKEDYKKRLGIVQRVLSKIYVYPFSSATCLIATLILSWIGLSSSSLFDIIR